MKLTLTTFALTAMLAGSAFAQGQPGGHFVENWDYDQNGEVSLQEATDRRADIFVTFDENGDGMLDAAEYVAFDEARAADMQNETGAGKKGHGRAAVGMTLEFNDTDGDGAVSQAEFIAGSEAWFAILDRNQDGVVTSADFGQQ